VFNRAAFFRSDSNSDLQSGTKNRLRQQVFFITSSKLLTDPNTSQVCRCTYRHTIVCVATRLRSAGALMIAVACIGNALLPPTVFELCEDGQPLRKGVKNPRPAKYSPTTRLTQRALPNIALPQGLNSKPCLQSCHTG